MIQLGQPTDVPGCLAVIVNEENECILVQSDWDWPGIASTFGWVPCPCGETDGTIDCKHRKASEMIQEAGRWIQDHYGEVVEDPGYFS